MTSAETLRGAVAAFFESHADHFGLEARSVEVAYVLNPGGFVNFSYRIGDGRTALHAKLATTGAGRAALARWHALDPLLRRHRAPPVLAAIEVGGAGGLVFPWLAGATPDLDEAVARSVAECAAGLWTDAALADRLRGRRAITAADCYREGYQHRFEADLAEVEALGLPFLDGGDVARLWAEVRAMERRVGEAAAFQEEVSVPVHGDLWPGNVLWESPRSWWLLDWDDVGIGDPAMDVAMLTGPTAGDLRPLKHGGILRGALTPAGRERVELLGRAALLDWAIDPLADWVEATVAPGHQAGVRSEKERVHREAWALYRRLYPA